MIKFESFANSIDNIELKPSESFTEIKNEGPISKEQAAAFWDDIFDEKELKETFDIFDYLPEIFCLSEKEFEFDIDFADDLAECLDEFGEDSWAELTFDEKMEQIEKLVGLISNQLGLKDKLTISFYEGPDNSCGAFNQGHNTMELNRSLLNNPKELVDTIAHELRHAYQYQRAVSPETFLDLLYRLNFENYIEPIRLSDDKYLYFTDYQDQLIEAEARAYARQFSRSEVAI